MLPLTNKINNFAHNANIVNIWKTWKKERHT